MKLKIFTLLLLFNLTSFSSFAVIDVKQKTPNTTTQHFKKDTFSKNKKLKKQKFRLRKLFVIKKKFWKAKKKNEKKESKKANWSLGLSILGIIIVLALTRVHPLFSFLGILSSIISVLLGILGLKEIKENPDTLKGKSSAWGAIIISIVWILLMGLLFLGLIGAF